MSFRALSLPASEDLICCWSSSLRSSVALDQRFSSCLRFHLSDVLSECDPVDLQGFCARDGLGKEAIESIVICYSIADGFHRVGSRINKATDALYLVTWHSATAKMPNAK